MQLTQFSDYSLRVVLYLAARPERPVALQEISVAYGVSQHHLVKVTGRLIGKGFVTSVRGRHGGLRLSRAPEAINIGDVVRATEPHFNIVECFDEEHNACPIDSACGLKGVLQAAQAAFMRELDRYTLADFLPHAPALIPLWRTRPQAPGDGSRTVPGADRRARPGARC